jgi:pilus assembly protein Flp/PilA
MTKALVKLQNRLQSEKGATAVEYGLLVALIAAVIIAVVVVLGTQISEAFGSIVAEL